MTNFQSNMSSSECINFFNYGRGGCHCVGSGLGRQYGPMYRLSLLGVYSYRKNIYSLYKCSTLIAFCEAFLTLADFYRFYNNKVPLNSTNLSSR
jgi:hypothetical protein